jgi:hypothetical protein
MRGAARSGCIFTVVKGKTGMVLAACSASSMQKQADTREKAMHTRDKLAAELRKVAAQASLANATKYEAFILSIRIRHRQISCILVSIGKSSHLADRETELY